jgi:hypothetical protein
VFDRVSVVVYSEYYIYEDYDIFMDNSYMTALFNKQLYKLGCICESKYHKKEEISSPGFSQQVWSWWEEIFSQKYSCGCRLSLKKLCLPLLLFHTQARQQILNIFMCHGQQNHVIKLTIAWSYNNFMDETDTSDDTWNSHCTKNSKTMEESKFHHFFFKNDSEHLHNVQRRHTYWK